MTAAPERKAPGKLRSEAGRNLITVGPYQVAAFLAMAFGQPIWLFEQRHGQHMERHEWSGK